MYRFNFTFQLCKIWFRRILFWFLHLEMWLWCYVIHLEKKTTMMDRFFDIQNSSAHFTSKVGCAERDLKVEFVPFLISRERAKTFLNFHLMISICCFFLLPASSWWQMHFTCRPLTSIEQRTVIDCCTSRCSYGRLLILIMMHK